MSTTRRADHPIASSADHPIASSADHPIASSADHPIASSRSSALHPPATLPDGMRMLTDRVVADGAPELARALKTTLWEVVHLPPGGDGDAPLTTIGMAVSALRACGESVLGRDEATVTRRRPDGGTGTVDLRPSTVPLHADARADDPTTDTVGSPCPALIIRALPSNDGPSVRPGDLPDTLAVHHEPTNPAPGEPRQPRRVVRGGVTEAVLREALTGDPIPLVPDDHAVTLEEVAR